MIQYYYHFFNFRLLLDDCGVFRLKFSFSSRIFLRNSSIFSRKLVSVTTTFKPLICSSVLTTLFLYNSWLTVFKSTEESISADFLLRIRFFLSLAFAVPHFELGLLASSQLSNLRCVVFLTDYFFILRWQLLRTDVLVDSSIVWGLIALGPSLVALFVLPIAKLWVINLNYESILLIVFTRDGPKWCTSFFSTSPTK